jgi:hypothetical protein
LAAPEGNVYFAGEATSNNHPSTVIGAMESGLRAAGEIDAAIDPVPEPGAILQLIAGGIGLALLNKRRTRENLRAKPAS